MPEEPTCGQGLAEHAELPLLLGELMGSGADNLQAHLPGLVSSDVNSQNEKHVYEHLATRLREAGALLHAIGTEMAGIRTCRWANTILERCHHTRPSRPWNACPVSKRGSWRECRIS